MSDPISDPVAVAPVVLDAPTADETIPAPSHVDDVPPGQIENPDVPTPGDAIDKDQPEDATPAVADDPTERDAPAPGSPVSALPPGAYLVQE